VVAASEVLFGSRDLRSTDAETLEVVAAEVPRVSVPRGRMEPGLPIVDALVETGLASSKADARRGIQGQGYSINGVKVQSPDQTVRIDDMIAGRFVALQKGKRAFAIIDVR
jgi:tyrosyl-tRNA synthetase